MAACAPHVVLVEWTGTTADQLAPRLRAQQLPALDAAARLGRWNRLSPTANASWPWPAEFTALKSTGISLSTHGWPHDARSADTAGDDTRVAPDDTRVAPDDIDPRVLEFFPPADESTTVALRAVLANLYSTHNALVHVASSDAAPAFIAGRYELIEPIAQLYAQSPALPQALLAAHRLLDLLLADVNAARDERGALIVCAPPLDGAAGFACVYARRPATAELPNVTHVALLPDAIFTLLGRTSPSGLPANAAWLQPEIVPREWTAASPANASAANAETIVLRRASTSEHARLGTLFPDETWPADAVTFVLADKATHAIHAAASLSDDGGLSLGFAPTFSIESEISAALVNAALAEAPQRGHAEITLRHPVPKDGARHRLLSGAGFTEAGEQTLWLATVPAMLERARRLAGKAGGEFHVGSSRVDLQACKLEYSIVSPK